MATSSFRDTFLKFFPAPQFLRMPAVGFDLTDHTVRLVELVDSREGLRLGKYGYRKIPDGVLSYGEIKDEEGLRSVLVDIRRKFNLEFIRASLPEEKAYVFRMDVPLLTPDEVREHIAFELEEHVPLPLGDAVFDYQEVPGASKAGETRAVTVSVFPRKTVEAYTTMYLSAGLIPLGFEMEGDAMARAVVRKGDYGTYLLVDFGTERTGISIVSQGAVEFSSTVDIGGATLTAAIQKYFSISMEEAEKIKQEGRFARTGKDQDLFASLMNSVSALRDEINKHVNYWQTRPAQDGDPVKPIEKIILCGGDSNLSGFPEHLALTVTIPVELADVWINTTALGPYVPPIRFNESLSYTAAIGLALAAR